MNRCARIWHVDQEEPQGIMRRFYGMTILEAAEAFAIEEYGQKVLEMEREKFLLENHIYFARDYYGGGFTVRVKVALKPVAEARVTVETSPVQGFRAEVD